MSRKWLAVAAAPPVIGVVLPLALLAGAAGGISLSSGNPGGELACVASAAGKFTSEQVSIAATAYKVAQQRKLPAHAVVIILATGMQESGIRNYANDNPAYPEVRRISMSLPHTAVGHDHDSVGWLQQRPIEGDGNWGTVKDLMTPSYAAGKFYDALVKIPGWQTLPVTVAAQRVQISAFGNAYAKWEDDARALLATAAGVDCSPNTEVAGGGPVPADFNRQGNPRTVEAAIAWYQRAMPYGVPGEPVLGMCERYSSTLAWGHGGGYASAAAHWTAPGPRVLGYSSPPRGALTFWAGGGGYGHVAVSLGNGQVISTDYNSATGRYQAGMISAGPITDIDKWAPRLGWRPPDTGKRF